MSELSTEDKKEIERRMRHLTNQEILDQAASIVWTRNILGEHLKGPNDIKRFLEFKMAKHDREVFGILLFNAEHRVIDYHELFYGTVDKVSTYCRPIAECALTHNAVGVALVHSHPRRTSVPSSHDITLTKKLREMLAPLDIYLIDHYIVGTDFHSMRFQGFKELFG